MKVSYEAQERIKALGSNNIIVRSVKPQMRRESKTTAVVKVEVRYGLTYDDTARISPFRVERVLPMRLIRERIRF